MTTSSAFDTLIKSYTDNLDNRVTRKLNKRILEPCKKEIILDQELMYFHLGWMRMAVMEIGPVEASVHDAVTGLILNHLNQLISPHRAPWTAVANWSDRI